MVRLLFVTGSSSTGLGVATNYSKLHTVGLGLRGCRFMRSLVCFGEALSIQNLLQNLCNEAWTTTRAIAWLRFQSLSDL